MGNLIYNLITVRNDGMELFKSLETFIVEVESFVYQSKVVDCFNAISLYTNSFQEELLRSIIVFLVIETITLVDQCFRVISIVLDGQICKAFSAFEVVLKEIQE